MRKIQLILLAFLFNGFILSSCIECDDFEYEGEEIAPSAMLTDGLWDLDWIEFASFEDGNSAEEWTEEYGPGTENGICTFDFSPENECVMVDVENEVEDSYVIYEDGNMRIGDEIYRIEELTEERLDLVVFFAECGDDDDDDDEEEREENGQEEHMHFTR